jgi:phage shock protein A
MLRLCPIKRCIRMEREVQEIRSSVTQASVSYAAAYKLTNQKYETALAEVKKWEDRIRMARSKGEIYLAKEAEMRLLQAKQNADGIRQILADSPQPQTLNHENLSLLEAKLAEAKMNRYHLMAAIANAKAEAMINGF